MNKSELISVVAEAASISKAAAGKAVNGMMEAISETLSNGDSVTLVGFGTFSTSKRAARTGRNPLTGKPLKIAAKTVAKFKAGKNLVDSVN